MWASDCLTEWHEIAAGGCATGWRLFGVLGANHTRWSTSTPAISSPSIEVSGHDEFTLSTGIHEQIQSLIGENLDQAALDSLTDRIRKELHAKAVTYHIVRGDQPEQVKVSFEITRRSIALEVNVPKFFYHSTQGFSGVIEGVTGYGTSSVMFRALSDNDELVERNTGILARYEKKKLGNDRVGLAFQFESYHPKWNRVTEAADDPSVFYRNRQNFEPSVTIVIAKPLTLTAGVSFERFQTQFPAARIESANAMVNTLRYHRLLEDSDAKNRFWTQVTACARPPPFSPATSAIPGTAGISATPLPATRAPYW